MSNGKNGNGHSWSKFWWQDWQGDDALRMCSLAAQGLWMRILCVAHNGTPIGHLTINGRAPTIKQLAAIVGASPAEVTPLLHELGEAGVYSRTEDGTIYCRRMVRDAEIIEKSKVNGALGGNPHLKRRVGKGVNPPHNPPVATEVNSEVVRGDKLQEAKKLREEEAEGEVREPRARGHTRTPRLPLPDDWQPDAASRAKARGMGLSEAEISADLEKFRDWAAANGVVQTDWNARYRLWFRETAYRDRQRRVVPATTQLREEFGSFLIPPTKLLQ